MNRQPLLTSYKSTVPNYFANYKTFSYTESEVVDRYIALFDEGIYPGKKSILALLNATHDFLLSTNPRSNFKQVRKERFSDNELKKELDDMGNALAEAIKKRNELLAKNGIVKNSNLEPVLTNTIDYCMSCVKYRLEELSIIRDAIYTIFQTQDNELKNVLSFALQQSAPRPK